MKQFLRTLKYFLVNGSFAACVYFGFFKSHNGAENLAIFYIWFSFIISLTFMSKEVLKDASSRYNGPSVPRWFDSLFDLSIVFFTAYCGRFFLASIYLVSTLLFIYAIEEMKTLKEVKKC